MYQEKSGNPALEQASGVVCMYIAGVITNKNRTQSYDRNFTTPALLNVKIYNATSSRLHFDSKT
jgi:hypothetical protein